MKKQAQKPLAGSETGSGLPAGPAHDSRDLQAVQATLTSEVTSPRRSTSYEVNYPPLSPIDAPGRSKEVARAAAPAAAMGAAGLHPAAAVASERPSTSASAPVPSQVQGPSPSIGAPEVTAVTAGDPTLKAVLEVLQQQQALMQVMMQHLMGQNGVSMQQQQAIYGQPVAFAATGAVSATALTPSPVQGGVVGSAADGTLASSVGVAARASSFTDPVAASTRDLGPRAAAPASIVPSARVAPSTAVTAGIAAQASLPPPAPPIATAGAANASSSSQQPVSRIVSFAGATPPPQTPMTLRASTTVPNSAVVASPESIHSFGSAISGSPSLASSMAIGGVLATASIKRLEEAAPGSVQRFIRDVSAYVDAGTITNLAPWIGHDVLEAVRQSGYGLVPGTTAFERLSALDQLHVMRSELLSRGRMVELSRLRPQPIPASAKSYPARLSSFLTAARDFTVRLAKWRDDFNADDRDAVAHFWSQYPRAFKDAFIPLVKACWDALMSEKGASISGGVDKAEVTIDSLGFALNRPEKAGWPTEDLTVVWSKVLGDAAFGDVGGSSASGSSSAGSSAGKPPQPNSSSRGGFSGAHRGGKSGHNDRSAVAASAFSAAAKPSSSGGASGVPQSGGDRGAKGGGRGGGAGRGGSATSRGGHSGRGGGGGSPPKSA